jgi:signal transduction histidine kinase
MQLENSLFLANERSRELLLERIPLKEVIQSTGYRWPNLVVTVAGDALVHADSRALECIVTNLIQNAVTHGRASEMTVTCSRASNSMLQVSFRDNGVGFSGDVGKLGGLFSRFYSGSGNGIGLYLVSSLARQMRGDVQFVTDRGFEVHVTLPGELIAA